jgi:protein SCO1/2
MSVPKRIGLILAAACVVVVATILLGGVIDRLSGPENRGTVQIGGPFELTDHTGKTVTDLDFRGRYMLIYFGYSYCPDVCPTELAKMSLALDLIGDKADRIAPIFITVDPERDTSAHLATYVTNFHERMVGLTGTEQQVSQAAKAYRIYFRKVEDETSTDYLMDHSSIIYLMGPDGKYVTHFSHGTNAEDIAKRLNEIL